MHTGQKRRTKAAAAFEKKENKRMTVQELYDVIGDYGEVKKRLMNDKIIGKFVVRFPEDPSYGQLMSAWEKQDSQEIFRAAHTLKGVCANLSLSELLKTAELITEAYRPGQEDRLQETDMPQAIKKLQEQYQDTVTAIQNYEKDSV